MTFPDLPTLPSLPERNPRISCAGAELAGAFGAGTPGFFGGGSKAALASKGPKVQRGDVRLKRRGGVVWWVFLVGLFWLVGFGGLFVVVY